MKLILITGLFFGALCSCSSKKEKFLADITALQLMADSATADLATIDSGKAAEWYDDYITVKYELIAFAEKDTIPLEMGEAVDNYMTSISSVEFLPKELENCRAANDSLKIRLKLLRTDIENQQGERSQYEAFIQKESRETKAVRKHAEILKENYLAAEEAQAQFLPAIERFIRTFVTQ